MKKKTLLIAVAAIVLAVVTAASVTVAWLNAESDTVTNTFTYGNIAISLDETSEYAQATQITGGMKFDKVIPGDTISKEPVITVETGSELCYVYVLVTNNLVLDNLANAVTYDIITDATQPEYWTVVKTIGNSVLYRYSATIDASTAAKTVTVFENVSFAGALTVADVNALAAIEDGIVIKAYAHQAEHALPDDADTAATTWATNNAN